MAVFDFPTAWNILFTLFFHLYQTQSLVTLQGWVGRLPSQFFSISTLPPLKSDGFRRPLQEVSAFYTSSYHLYVHLPKAVSSSEWGPASVSGFYHQCLVNSRDLQLHSLWTQAKLKRPWKEEVTTLHSYLSWPTISDPHSWGHICSTLKAWLKTCFRSYFFPPPVSSAAVVLLEPQRLRHASLASREQHF